ncbi:Hypothetical_protein [Hexamita inflata]|uniref:Hypothetical_protein n=1 Tax=Hexamita inflata TaxID=28002 RepID=A0ABP1KJD9_9EUKA
MQRLIYPFHQNLVRVNQKSIHNLSCFVLVQVVVSSSFKRVVPIISTLRTENLHFYNIITCALKPQNFKASTYMDVSSSSACIKRIGQFSFSSLYKNKMEWYMLRSQRWVIRRGNCQTDVVIKDGRCNFVYYFNIANMLYLQVSRELLVQARLFTDFS